MSDETIALILLGLAGWVIGSILAFFNPLLIWLLDANKHFKAINFGVFFFYLICGLALWLKGSEEFVEAHREFWLIGVFGIPLMAISHFFYLLWMKRRIRLNKQRAFGA